MLLACGFFYGDNGNLSLILGVYEYLFEKSIFRQFAFYEVKIYQH